MHMTAHLSAHLSPPLLAIVPQYRVSEERDDDDVRYDETRNNNSLSCCLLPLKIPANPHGQ